MKKSSLFIAVFAFLIASCSNDTNDLSDLEQIQQKTDNLAEGKAMTGIDFYDGVLAAITNVDLKYQQIEELDRMDAPVEEFYPICDSCVARANKAISALNAYKNLTFPHADEFRKRALALITVMKETCDGDFRDLADQYSRPDDTWTDDDYAIYDKFSAKDGLLKQYSIADSVYVSFQETYANANNFSLTSTIDMDTLVKQEMSNNNTNQVSNTSTDESAK